MKPQSHSPDRSRNNIRNETGTAQSDTPRNRVRVPGRYQSNSCGQPCSLAARKSTRNHGLCALHRRIFRTPLPAPARAALSPARKKMDMPVFAKIVKTVVFRLQLNQLICLRCQRPIAIGPKHLNPATNRYFSTQFTSAYCIGIARWTQREAASPPETTNDYRRIAPSSIRSSIFRLAPHAARQSKLALARQSHQTAAVDYRATRYHQYVARVRRVADRIRVFLVGSENISYRSSVLNITRQL